MTGGTGSMQLSKARPASHALRRQAELTRDGVPQSFRPELDGGWTLRFGPLPASDLASALAPFRQREAVGRRFKAELEPALVCQAAVRDCRRFQSARHDRG
jgi:hypothetical protein